MITLNPHLFQHLTGFDRLLADLEWVTNRASCRSSRRRSRPKVNVLQSDDTVLVMAEVPGVKPEDLDIKAHGDRLIISGSRTETKGDCNDQKDQCGRSDGTFRRELTLPFRIDPEAVDATCKNGTLTVRLNRAKDDRPRKITVNS